MIVQLNKNITLQQLTQLKTLITSSGYAHQSVDTQMGSYLICLGNDDMDIRQIGAAEGVDDVYRVSDDYKLVSRKWKQGTSIVSVGGMNIGDGTPAVIAGPCAIESETQVSAIVEHLKRNGVNMMRGGVFKPRSSPYAFQGLGITGLELFHQVCRANGIGIISEVMEISQIEQMHDYVDMFQIGARNTQNFNLLRALGKSGKPVLLKRGI
ncbi:MAG: 3-deoxy-7-phosphoheptulonate synthase, partial [Sphingobacteriales bacterium]